ncbi:L,D-transpeptidase family protein [Bdellovibrio sp. HCB337]|uniref:L,D-transpeptidase family protein n=1 Tax=Bdellovibrio sp. HCB337 TaxID=3394358 RepID=UPI0039A42082
MKQLRLFLVAVFFVHLFSAWAWAFELVDIDPLATKEEKAYLAAVDVFPIEAIRSVAATMTEHGLNPRKYWSEDMESRYQKGGDSRLKARANKNFLLLLKDISIGAVDPALLPKDIKIERKKFYSPKQLQALIVSTGQNASVLVNSLAPQSPPYIALKSMFQKVSSACQNNTWVVLKRSKKPLKLGVQDPNIINVKNHLRFLGYSIPNQDDIFDADTEKAVNDIEWNMHMKPDGIIHPSGQVWKFLMTSCKDRVQQLQADMEKMRWFPQQFGDRYIFINLAMTYFVLVDKTQNPPYVTSFRTINGRSERKSPTMKDKIVEVILNPFWVVPPTIFIEDKVEEIKALPQWQIRYYFESRNYEIWNHDWTQKVDPESINWWAITPGTDAEIYIRQKPHYWNALGVVKFELTNSFSIYLHDTNQRELFYEAQRLLSSGCIRLEKPMDLAEYLLKGTEWDRAKIEATVAKPGEVMKDDTPIKLKNPIPVYTVFLTSFLGNDGILRFTDDSYGQNRNILKNLIAL